MLKPHIMTAAALCGLSVGAAYAASHAAECAMSYDVFEASVPHTDMAECPASMSASEDEFCRVSVVAEVATVFVFSLDTNCLERSQSFYEDEFTFVIE